MLQILSWMMFALYCLASGLLLLYAINCYVMLVLFARRRRQAGMAAEAVQGAHAAVDGEELPFVTTQLPLYNEHNVAERIIRAAAALEYPQGRHEIQVLDDSTDDTRDLVDRVVAELQQAGTQIEVLRREDRQGFKAGALAAGTAVAKGELLAIFDADFVPESDFLRRVIPEFLADPQVGLVQARWGHLNRCSSILTRIQAIGIDGHFMVEQPARAWNGLFMNFNGTAGVWRRQAIEDAGGWQWDTLTEDMDLSYRAQFAGWRTRYQLSTIAPAELPESILAFKSQQFRWAKGSIQTARKLLPRVWREDCPWFRKAQALLHLTHYCIHPLMLTMALLALPVMLTTPVDLPRLVYGVVGGILLVSMSAPSTLYLGSQQTAYRDWPKRIVCLPFLVCLGVGLAVSNTRAVVEALLGRESGFVRTPKQGDVVNTRYRVPLSLVVLAELLLGLYCAGSFYAYILAELYWIGPFLGVYAAGFLAVGLLSVGHSAGLAAVRIFPAGWLVHRVESGRECRS